MKVPGIEEIDETYLGGIVQAIQARTDGVTWNDDIRRAGLLAVFETHVRGMLAEAFAAGNRQIQGGGKRPEEYANRVLAQLKEHSSRQRTQRND